VPGKTTTIRILATLVQPDAGTVQVLRRDVVGEAGDAAGLHPVLDQVDPQVQVAAHLDRTAEGDLAVALAEVQVTDGELAAVDDTGR
jgi:ABC-type multidrug transport system ATPase subunit